LEARLGLNGGAALAPPVPRAPAPIPDRPAPPPIAASPAPAAFGAAPPPLAADLGEEAEANWPTATEEAAFLNGPREEINLPVPSHEAARSPAAETEAVPPVEELIQQIPAEVRATLDELFRARFNRVMRAKPKN
jgi:hypothetical protein